MTNLSSDPFKFLLDRKRVDYSESFTLPKTSIPSLRHLNFVAKSKVNRGIEEFLDVNPNVESLLLRYYDLNIDSSLIYVKHLDIDEKYNFHNTDQAFRLSSINSLIFSTRDFKYSENIKKLCHLCPNVAKLSIKFLGTESKFQPIINNYLAPILSNLHNLKTLVN